MKTTTTDRSGMLSSLIVCLVLSVFAAGLHSCSDDDDNAITQNLKVSQVVVEGQYTIPSDGTITILGNGFASGDKITLTNAAKEVYTATTTAVSDNSITISLPGDFPQTGTYTLRVVRADEDIVLGNASIELVYDFGVADIVVDPKYTVAVGKPIRVAGNGFLASDVLTFTATTTAKNGTVTYGDSYTAQTQGADATGIDVLLPTEMTKGDYTVGLLRQGRAANIGATALTFVMDTEMPSQPGATLMGMVYCGYEPVGGVVVSDGVSVTTTDDQGRYYLNSAKSLGYVFVSTPGGYTIANISGTNTPEHFKRTAAASDQLEQIDFELVSESQTNFVVMAFADMHLAKRNDDLDQFANGFIKDANALIADYAAAGKKVYGITLGDQSWDLYWYDNSFALPQAMEQVAKINCQVYNCMGNHDNDPYCADNFRAQQAYIDNVGPNYYSFNIGDGHYVVLDDTYYINTGGLQGTVGDRSYTSQLDDVQLQWLRRDLATVADKSKPLYICMHIPLHSYPYVNGSGVQSQNVGMASGSELLDAVSDFTDVKVLSGHTHVNYDGVANDGRVFEQNTAAVCATWWWTGRSGYAGNHICRDGIPGGYGVWETAGVRTTHYYKSIGYPADYQFRTTDLNQVHITAERYAPKCSNADILAKMADWTAGYETPSSANQVLINVFNWGQGWSIKVTENGKALTANRVYKRDPLHIISYEMQRLNQGGSTVPTESFMTLPSTKTFMVTATSPTSTLEVTVTDRYGNAYTETMTRPKAFHVGMY